MKRVTLSHGLSRTPEYRAWQTMRHRCTNPSSPAWPNYGGRGIRICDRWLNDPAAFIADVGPRPSTQHEIDRINNDGHYEPGNVRWVTRTQNCRNRRSSLWVEYRGEQHVLADLREKFGIRADTLKNRLAKGWALEDALERPVRRKAPNGSAARSGR